MIIKSNLIYQLSSIFISESKPICDFTVNSITLGYFVSTQIFYLGVRPNWICYQGVGKPLNPNFMLEFHHVCKNCSFMSVF